MVVFSLYTRIYLREKHSSIYRVRRDITHEPFHRGKRESFQKYAETFFKENESKKASKAQKLKFTKCKHYNFNMLQSHITLPYPGYLASVRRMIM